MEYKFHLNNLRIAPRKVRLVANLIKKSSVISAQASLKFQSKKAALPILKLLKSAVSSAANNFNLSSENLYIANIFVDEGQKLKRFRPRAFGRAGAIHKKTSHITLILEERISAAKKRKKPIKTKVVKEGGMPEVKGKIETETFKIPRKEIIKEIKPVRKIEGFARRIFRRKAIG